MIADYLKIYAAALVAFLAIDFTWLVFVARGFYRKQLGGLICDPPNWWAAISFYLLFVVGLLVFAVLPALQAGSLQKAIILGGLFGLIAYATYDLTNLATLKDWPWLLSLVDMTWGLVLTASVSCIGYLVGRWLS